MPVPTPVAYDFSQPLRSYGNLAAACHSVVLANRYKFEDVDEPIQTSDGPYALLRKQRFEDGVRPACLCWQRGRRMIVAVAGIQGAADARRVYNGWVNAAEQSGTGALVNQYAFIWYENSRATYTFVRELDPDDVLFVGHSWGSTLATLWSQQLKREYPRANVSLVTYGSPKWCSVELPRSLSLLASCRVHNWGDIVPYLMPTSGQAPVFVFAHGAQVGRNADRQIHLSGGLGIKAGAMPFWDEQPQGIATPLDVNPQAVMDVLATQLTPHLAETYEEVLASYVDRLAVVSPTGTAPAAAATPNNPPRLSAADAERGVQAATVVRPTLSNVTVPPAASRPKVRVRRVGQQWTVQVAGRVVHYAESRRSARSFARSLRSFTDAYASEAAYTLTPDELFAVAVGAAGL